MKRIIARLDVKGANVVRGIHLEGLRVVGRPEDLALKYYEEGIDEIIFIDTVATLYGRNTMTDVIERTAGKIFIPLTAGGGIRNLEDAKTMLRSGADKITLNSAAVNKPELITEISTDAGRQCVVVAIEAKKGDKGNWMVMVENGREATGLDAVEWAERACAHGAGELLVTSIDQDGTKRGFDLQLCETIRNHVDIPVIASGGAGSVKHIEDIFTTAGVDAVALGSCLHFNLVSVSQIKSELNEAQINVRTYLGEQVL